jgi:uncharacterized protein YndB with AHSA1/START domain
VQPDPAPAFVHSRLIPAPPEQVFAAFSNPALLARWWGPEGFTNTIHQFDCRTGGRWQLTMQGPDGANYPNEFILRDVMAPQRVVLEHIGAPHFVLTIELQSQGAGAEQTRVHWRQQFDDEATYHHIAAIVGPANEQNLSRWAAVVAAQAGAGLKPVSK